MPERREYSEDQIAEAMTVYAEHGPAEAERRLGDPEKRRWARGQGAAGSTVATRRHRHPSPSDRRRCARSSLT
jgi:hypothetical protein